MLRSSWISHHLLRQVCSAAAGLCRRRPACLWLLLAVPGLRLTAAEAYQPPAMDRYLPIVARQPFGLPPPPPPPPTPPPSAAAAEALPAKNFVLFEIVHTPSGEVIVGFADNGAKPPRNLLMELGEELDGYVVKAVDFDQETATITKDGQSVELRMTGSERKVTAEGGAAAAGAPSAGTGASGHRPGRFGMGGAAARRPAEPPAEKPLPTSVAGIDRLLNAGTQDDSYVGRLRSRREQLMKLAAEAQSQREQEIQAKAQVATTNEMGRRLREANLNLIRKGLKPIGTIELTPEEDAKLVDEGVLQPAQ